MTAVEFDNPGTRDGFARGKEYLGSVRVGATIHAAYPTATNALCGLRFGCATPDQRGPFPDCVECASTARTFDRIDDSAPPTWRKAWKP